MSPCHAYVWFLLHRISFTLTENVQYKIIVFFLSGDIKGLNVFEIHVYQIYSILKKKDVSCIILFFEFSMIVNNIKFKMLVSNFKMNFNIDIMTNTKTFFF